MALSQKHAGKILVPWYNSNEWKYVKDLIYSNKSNNETKSDALKILKMWKRRMPLLSSGVEGSLVVLEALLIDQTMVDEHNLQAIYAAALMRFLNLCPANNERQGTFYQTARKNKIPDWIIDLRHEFAHAHQLPSLHMLKLGLDFSLEWLEREYWIPHSLNIQDLYIDDPRGRGDSEFKSYFALLCAATTKYYYNGKYELEQRLKEFLCDILDETSHIKHLQNTVLKLLWEKFPYAHKELLVDILTECEGFLSVNNLCIENEECLPKRFVQSWENIVCFFTKEKILFNLLKKLNLITGDKQIENSKQKVAALWLSEICNSFLKQKILKESKNTDSVMKEESLPRSIMNLKYDANVLGNLLVFKDYVMNDPNVFTLLYLTPLLKILGLEEDYIEDIRMIIESKTIVSQALNDSDSVINSEIFERLRKEGIDVDSVFTSTASSSSSYDISQVPNLFVEPANIELNGYNNEEETPKKRWRKVLNTSAFKGLPLGAVPEQPREKNIFVVDT